MKKTSLYFLFGIISIFLLWIVFERIIGNQIALPSIQAVFLRLKEIISSKENIGLILKTLTRLTLTVLSMFVIALLFAGLSSIDARIESFLKPSIILIKTTPVAAIIILFLMVLGNERSPFIITGMVVFPLLYEAILNAISTMDRSILDEVKLIGKRNTKVFFGIIVPVVAPAIISAFVQSFGLGLKVMVMAEVIAMPSGTIGYQIAQERALFRTDAIFAWTIILIILVVLVDVLLKQIQKRIIKNR